MQLVDQTAPPPLHLSYIEAENRVHVSGSVTLGARKNEQEWNENRQQRQEAKN